MSDRGRGTTDRGSSNADDATDETGSVESTSDETGESAGVESADDDPAESGETDGALGGTGDGAREELRDAAQRVGETATSAADGFDERLVDLLSWVLDTETRARIYTYLRRVPGSTSAEIADGTDLYPSTVREALAGLHDDGFVTRCKRVATGAGNNPYEYEAIPPADLVDAVVDDVQSGLNAVFNIDERLGRDEGDHSDPVRITVERESDAGATDRVGTDDPTEE